VSGINISQVCPGCSAETGCICIVDVSVSNMSASLGLDTPTTFNQYCPAEFSTCISINSAEQTSTVIPFNYFFDGANSQVYDTSIPGPIIVIILIVIILVLLCLFALIFADSNTVILRDAAKVNSDLKNNSDIVVKNINV